MDPGTLTLAKLLSKALYWLSPRGYTLAGDTPWRGHLSISGKEDYAPNFIYSNEFSCRTGKKVVYFQSPAFFSAPAMPHGGLIVFVVRCCQQCTC